MSDSQATENAGAALAPAPIRAGSNIGQGISRRDGVHKVTGSALYSADNRPDGMLHAACAVSSIARGRVVFLDRDAALAHPGVVMVMTPGDRLALAQHPDDKPTMYSFRIEALQDDSVRYAGQPIAMVVATSPEAAIEAAALLAPRYEAQTPRIGLDDGEAFSSDYVGFGSAARFAKGDIEDGFAAATETTTTSIEIPDQYHNPMEPHAVVAAWDGDQLTLDTPSQGPYLMRTLVAGFFGIDPEKVLIRTPYIGGGFGSKLLVHGPHVLAALAARELGRPVKLEFSRNQLFGLVGRRAETRQQVRLGADAAGRLTALEHRVETSTSSFENFIEPAGHASLHLYASPSISISHDVRRLDKGTPWAMRGPGEAAGSAALECAIDEAAFACGLDPLEFRLRNYAETDPGTGRPFSSKALRECYQAGAERFGWSARPLAPRVRRNQQGHLVGWGMGTAQYQCTMYVAEARVTLRDDGSALAELSGIDMGQGAWTIFAQIAADGVALPVDAIELRSGASDLPDASVAGGSGHAATAGTALHAAGQDALAGLMALAMADPASPLYGADNAGIVARDGRLYNRADDSRSEAYGAILKRAGQVSITGNGVGRRAEAAAKSYAMFSHGAVFAEVCVDPDLGQVRVSRMVGAFAAGRIINPKLVRSQIEGGMIWGLSFALHEEAVYDHRSGRVMNGDLAGYHIPAHADIPAMETIMVHEEDPHVNALGVKGVGEVGITGSVGAIANAIWHATGIRTTQFPIRMETLIG